MIVLKYIIILLIEGDLEQWLVAHIDALNNPTKNAIKQTDLKY
jgi:hypothetical protein